jgi:hypothetical protein
MTAGILEIQMRPKKTRVTTRAEGNRNIYAPRTPEMAPLAPTIGSMESGPLRAKAYAAIIPENR